MERHQMMQVPCVRRGIRRSCQKNIRILFQKWLRFYYFFVRNLVMTTKTRVLQAMVFLVSLSTSSRTLSPDNPELPLTAYGHSEKGLYCTPSSSTLYSQDRIETRKTYASIDCQKPNSCLVRICSILCLLLPYFE
jgi:hypothetical protein